VLWITPLARRWVVAYSNLCSMVPVLV
jgi:hypothetical protein